MRSVFLACLFGLLAPPAPAQETGSLGFSIDDLRREKQEEDAAFNEESRPRKAPQPQDTCLSSRWHIKTLSDQDAAVADAEPRETSIGALAKLEAPAKRFAPFRHEPEKIVWRVKGQVMGYEYEEDHDYHVVLADRDDPKKTMIVEIPDPGCPKTRPSRYAGRFAQARAAFEKEGAAPNGIELHPVLSIEAAP